MPLGHRPEACAKGASMTPIELAQVIRKRIVADLHLGRLKPGGRLPSLREVAREYGISIRAAARAYSELEREGLVKVRGRSGIYLVLPQTVDIDLEEPLDWYAEMLRDAWSRRIPITEVNMTLQQIVQNPVQVACVESTEDHMVAFCAELAEDFALQTTSVMLTKEGARVGDAVMSLYDAISGVDFVVTTAFHAAEVKVAADLLKKPVVLVSVNDTMVDAIERQLETGPVTIVGEDPAFISRMCDSLIERFKDNGELRVIGIDEYMNNPAMTEGTTPLFTRAARRRLNEDEYHLLPAPIPFLSANAARKLVRCMLSTHQNRSLQIA
jgi:DNA-binding transcriptional regulator YhcF (GntR family)